LDWEIDKDDLFLMRNLTNSWRAPEMKNTIAKITTMKITEVFILIVSCNQNKNNNKNKGNIYCRFEYEPNTFV
jgi:hypothetical protein